jgi:hypothetical protein
MKWLLLFSASRQKWNSNDALVFLAVLAFALYCVAHLV